MEKGAEALVRLGCAQLYQLYKGWHCGVLLSRRELEVQGTRYRYKVQGTRFSVLGVRSIPGPVWFTYPVGMLQVGAANHSDLPVSKENRGPTPVNPCRNIEVQGLKPLHKMVEPKTANIENVNSSFPGARRAIRTSRFVSSATGIARMANYQGRFFRLAGLKRQPSAPCRLNSMLSSAKR